MRRVMEFLVLGLAVLTVQASEQPTPKPAQTNEFSSLKKSYDEALQKFQEERSKEAKALMTRMQAERKAAEKAVQGAKTDEEKQAAKKRLQQASRFPAMMTISTADGPGAAFSPRFLAFAVENSKDSMALDALYMALVTSGGPAGKAGTWGGAVKALQVDQTENPKINRAVRLLRLLAEAHDDGADNVLRDVMAKNPDRKARGRACQALALGRETAGQLGEDLKAKADLRRNYEKLLGNARVVSLIAGAPAARKEAEELTRTLRAKYDDVCPDLSIGKAAPEVVSRGLDGEPAKLSGLKGKVVVLDIWATWCAPCRAMIPHERAMVDRLKDKPFLLVSISADEEKETLESFLAKEKMPWTHWWNGHEGGIIEDWNVEAYPRIYVLDANGVIRHKDLRGEKLEAAVNELLKEVEVK